MSDRAAPPYRVVILGGGFGGLYAARALAEYGYPAARLSIRLVDPAPAFVFKPLLYELLADELSEEEVAFPFGDVLAGTGIEWVRARVRSIDLAGRRVALEPVAPGAPEELGYDAVAIAIGAEPDFRGLPGLAEHALTASSLADFKAIRDRLRALDPGAGPATIAVCGAGPSGVEIAAKLADGSGATRRRVVLVEASGQILPGFGEEMKARALALLGEKGVEVRLRTPVRSASAGGLAVGSAGAPETIGAALVIWTAGQRPAAPARALPVERDPSGRILVPATLEVPGQPGVFALGDAARCAVEGAEAPPATAQVAVQQASVVARNLVARLEGRTLRSFRYFPLAETLSLGVGYDILHVLGLRLEGRAGHVARRLAYIARLPGWRQRASAGARWGLRLASDVLGVGLDALRGRRD